MADWENMDPVITKTHNRSFQTLGLAYQALGLAFDFLLKVQRPAKYWENLAKFLKSLPECWKGSPSYSEANTWLSPLINWYLMITEYLVF